MNILSAVLFVTFPVYAQHTARFTLAIELTQQQNKWKEMKEDTKTRIRSGNFSINRGASACISQSFTKFCGRNKLPYQKYYQLIWILISIKFFFHFFHGV